jgi:hypothetical protein
VRRLVPVAVVVVLAAGSVRAADQMYYRRSEDGTLVLTNVPDRTDLRPLRPEGRPVRPGQGAKYRDMIYRAAREEGIHPELAYAVAAVESSFDPLARSQKGAEGLMQLMPDTAARFGVTNTFDPADNVRGGVRFLRHLLDVFEGNLRLALAAYNAGENLVMTLGRVPPYDETRTYVAKVLRRFGPGRRPYVDTASPPPHGPEDPGGDAQSH